MAVTWLPLVWVSERRDGLVVLPSVLSAIVHVFLWPSCLSCVPPSCLCRAGCACACRSGSLCMLAVAAAACSLRGLLGCALFVHDGTSLHRTLEDSRANSRGLAVWKRWTPVCVWFACGAAQPCFNWMPACTTLEARWLSAKWLQ